MELRDRAVDTETVTFRNLRHLEDEMAKGLTAGAT
jgi:hypothetical protein